MIPIRVRGARQNCLQALDLDLPRHQLVAVCGISGSGKSSLVMDTLHAEGQRRYLEALAAGGVASPPSLRRPDVDAIQGLPPTIALSQHSGGTGPGSTVGTLLDLMGSLRVLVARGGEQHCPRCGALIRPTTIDEIVDWLAELPARSRVLLEAPVPLSQEQPPAGLLEEIARAGFSRVRLDDQVWRLDDPALSRQPPPQRLRIVVDRLRIRPGIADRLNDAVRTTTEAGHGAMVAVTPQGEHSFVDRPYCLRDGLELPPPEPSLLSTRGAGRCTHCTGSGEVDQQPCRDCAGSGLGAAARALRLEGASLPELCTLGVHELRVRLEQLRRDPVRKPPLDECLTRLELADRLGLGQLPIDRAGAELASGELQRLRLARHSAARLSGLLFLLDEPTAGLDRASARQALQLIRELVDQGNTVLMVEHRPQALRAADLVLELGPGSGREGGRLVFSGPSEDLMAADSPTARWLRGEHPDLPEAPPPGGWARLRGLSLLPGTPPVDLDLPLGTLGLITGPSGSGKTRLMDALRQLLDPEADDPELRSVEGLEPLCRVADVASSTRAGSSRSIPVSYVGAWKVLRELLAATREARVRGLSAADFSLNRTGGRCEACRGQGERRIDMHILPDIYLSCEICGGRRFTRDLLEVRWKGHSAAQLLDTPVREARVLLAGIPRLERALRALDDVGLGYMPLGQPGHTWSGGERQRMRIARELARARRSGGAEDTVYLLDDPTRGLHPADVHQLLLQLLELCATGATVWVASHHPLLEEIGPHVIRLLSPATVDESVDNLPEKTSNPGLTPS